MIISHKYKFIFIKMPKTAGTSIEVDFCKILGPDDIVTPIYPKEEGHTPQNYVINRYFGLKKYAFDEHMSAIQIRKRIGIKIWNSYFKFCVEREPVDKVLSQYFMFKNSPYHNREYSSWTFDKFIGSDHGQCSHRMYTGRFGGMIVDRILKYENLTDELKSVGNKLGFNLELTARAKSGFREHIDVTQAQKQKIYDIFSYSRRFTGYKLQDLT